MRTTLFFATFFIAATLTAQQNPATLKKTLREATTDSLRFNKCNELATYYTEMNKDSAIYYLDKAIVVARKNNKKLEEALALDTKGYCLMNLSRYSESLQCLLAAFKIAEDEGNESKTWFRDKKTPPRNIRLNILMNIHHEFGHLLGQTGKIEGQIIHYKKTLKISKEIGDDLMLGFVNMNIGSVYIDQNKLEQALKMEFEAERIFIKAGQKTYMCNVYNHIGRIYFRQNEVAKAVIYFHKSVRAAKEGNNISVLATTYGALSELYLTRKNPDSSLFYAKKQLAAAREMGSRKLAWPFTNLSNGFELDKEIDSAYHYQKLALRIKDSTYEATLKDRAKYQNISFTETQRLQELERKKADFQNRLKIYVLFSGLAVFLLIALILYRNNRKKLQLNKALEATLSNLKATQSQLIQSEKMASLGELTAGIAHEIQNPLNFVNNFSDVSRELISEILDERRKTNDERDEELIEDILSDIDQNLEKINHHGKRADSIVKGMLQHSQSSSGKKEATDINVLCDEYLRLSYHGIRAKDKSFNAKLETDFDASIGKIEIVAQDFGRVILNLLTNAFYAVNDKQKSGIENYEPTVSMATKRIADKVGISISDNGNGIPQAIVDKIFQPFFTTKPTGEGTGLGLSLAYDIVKAHGGEITVESNPEKGTTFTLKIPNTAT